MSPTRREADGGSLPGNDNDGGADTTSILSVSYSRQAVVPEPEEAQFQPILLDTEAEELEQGALSPFERAVETPTSSTFYSTDENIPRAVPIVLTDESS